MDGRCAGCFIERFAATVRPATPFVNFTCAQLTSSTNCDTANPDAVSFSNQSAGGAAAAGFSAQLGFGASNDVSYGFFFPADAFGTPGVYNADSNLGPFTNLGTLTVTVVATPEPTSALLLLTGVCFLGLARLRTKPSTTA
jgi:hypothetical protein